MRIGFKLLTFALIWLMGPVNAVWSAGSCHIHPLGTDAKEAERFIFEWYESMQECELANKKLFGGSGVCHCLPDGIFNRSGDDWRSWQRNFDAPQEPPSQRFGPE